MRIDDDGSATWLCHRCGWKGGVGRASSGRQAKWTPAHEKKQPEPEAIPLPPAAVRGALKRFGQAEWSLPAKSDRNTILAKKIWVEAKGLRETPAEAYVHRRGLIPVDADRAAYYPWAKLRVKFSAISLPGAWCGYTVSACPKHGRRRCC